jgi:glyoxylate reductase
LSNFELPIVCTAIPLSDYARERLEGNVQIRDVTGRKSGELPAGIEEAEGFLCGAPYMMGNDILDAAPHLRVIANHGVGFDNVVVDELNKRGIVCCNTPGVLNGAVADLTLGLMVGLARRMIDHNSFVGAGQWGNSTPAGLGFDLAGKTLGLVGFGRIGRTVAKRARGFDMNIVFHDQFTDPGEDDDCKYLPLDDLLAQSDFVSMHTNLSPETTHLISTRELGIMKDSAFLINTARGPVVDTEALAVALNNDVIAGAGLDVIEAEPPVGNEAILSAKNTILLPHVGSATVETRQAMLQMALDNLLAVLGGNEPRACVNPESLEKAYPRR